MPAQRGKSSLAAKYGAKLNEAVKAHANDPTDYGIQKLPPGISNGVAKLQKCGFNVYENGDLKGEFYFRASGVVVEPHSVMVHGKEIKVAGMHTSIMIPCCDTKNTRVTPHKVTPQSEYIAKIMNTLRALAGETYTSGATSAEILEALAEDVEKAAPYFNFSTSEGKVQLNPVTKKPQVDPTTGKPYEPRIWENWHGSKNLKDYTPPEVAPKEDDTGEAGEEAPPPPKAKATTKKAPPVKAPEPEPEPEAFDETTGDLNAWRERADNADEEATNYLTDLAIKAGWDEEEVKNADNWEQVVEMISNPKTDETVIEKGDMFHYVTLDKNKKQKTIEVEVISVDEVGRTAMVKDTTTKLSYKAVTWDKLIPIPQE